MWKNLSEENLKLEGQRKRQRRKTTRKKAYLRGRARAEDHSQIAIRDGTVTDTTKPIQATVG
jgi:hypothetical protein